MAERIAPHLSPEPGARVVRLTDDGAAFSDMLTHVAGVLSAGYSVVVDAPVLGAARRESIADVARQADVPFTGFRLAPLDDTVTAPANAQWLDVTASQGLPALLSMIRRATSRTGPVGVAATDERHAR